MTARDDAAGAERRVEAIVRNFLRVRRANGYEDSVSWECLKENHPYAVKNAEMDIAADPATADLAAAQEQLAAAEQTIREMRGVLQDLHMAFDFEEPCDATEMGFERPEALNDLFARAYAALAADAGGA